MNRNKLLKFFLCRETLIAIAAFVFLWMSIGLFYDSQFKKTDLTPHTGQVIELDSPIIKTIDKPLFKEVTKELKIKINTENTYFTFISTTGFGRLVSQIKLNDTIAVYTKSKLFGIFGMQVRNSICEIIQHDKIIFDFKNYKKQIQGLYIFTLAFSIACFIIYYIRIRRKYYSIL